MTNEEAIAFFKDMNECTYGNLEAVEMAIKALEQKPCNTNTCKVVKVYMNEWDKPITTEPKTGHCKDCKYFEYDSVAKVDGIPLIVAHEICSRWGDGCRTKEDGYCFLFEPQERIE